MRTVTLVALIGIGTSALCLSMSAAIVAAADDGPSWLERLQRLGRRDQVDRSSALPVVREIAWHGDDELSLNLPASVRFRPAPEWHATVRGPQDMLDRLQIEDGAISVAKRSGWLDAFDDDFSLVEIELAGPQLRNVTVNGSGDVVLDDLRQSELTIAINGSGSVRASGRVESLTASIAGSGDVSLADLVSRVVDLSIAGSGDADIAPVDEANVSIAGSGDVRLHSRPRVLRSTVSGSGEVTELPLGPNGRPPRES